MLRARQGGLASLKRDERGRPSGAGLLDSVQQARIYRIIVGKMPNQLKLPFYLWTRQAVVALIKREYAAELSLTTVGRYLKSWGMTAQKPVRRAYERTDEAIAQWCSKVYPALARQAKREGAQIYWGDEMGLRSDHVTGTSFAPVGSATHALLDFKHQRRTRDLVLAAEVALHSRTRDTGAHAAHPRRRSTTTNAAARGSPGSRALCSHPQPRAGPLARLKAALGGRPSLVREGARGDRRFISC